MTWSPIETAPRDGTAVLLFFPGARNPVQIGSFVDSEDFEYGKSVSKRQYWSTASSFMMFSLDKPKPSYWSHLPAAPPPVSAE